MEKIKELTKGKAKSLFTTSNDDQLIMHFSDDTSAFDGKKKEALLGKGTINNQFNAFIMEHLKENNVETHLIDVLNTSDSFDSVLLFLSLPKPKNEKNPFLSSC